MGLFVLLVWWLQHTRAREGAVAAVAMACRHHHYQFLDQAIHLKKMAIKRHGAVWQLLWIFYFEYFDGEARYRALVYWRGGRLLKIEFVHPPNKEEVLNPQKVVRLSDYTRSSNDS